MTTDLKKRKKLASCSTAHPKFVGTGLLLRKLDLRSDGQANGQTNVHFFILINYTWKKRENESFQ